MTNSRSLLKTHQIWLLSATLDIRAVYIHLNFFVALCNEPCNTCYLHSSIFNKSPMRFIYTLWFLSSKLHLATAKFQWASHINFHRCRFLFLIPVKVGRWNPTPILHVFLSKVLMGCDCGGGLHDGGGGSCMIGNLVLVYSRLRSEMKSVFFDVGR